jgi:hypothetical protein
MIATYNIYDYLLVLTPHEDLRNKIMHAKEAFSKSYNTSAALFIKPHILLAKFSQYAQTENRIVNKLHTIGMGFPAIKVSLKDFGSLPTHSVFINVTTKVPLQQLVKNIKSDTQKLMKIDDEHKPYFMQEPHIIVARKLLPWQYEQAWQEYKHKQFTASFIADGMLLLKRKLGEMKYQIVSRFAFENLPVATVQGALF